MSESIQPMQIIGARENNLKGVTLSIPKNRLVVVTGVSGSGKSSLVFDTIAVESMRQLSETFPLYIRNRMPHYERPRVGRIDCLSPAIVIRQRQFTGDARSTVGTMTDVAPMLRLLFSRCAQPHLGSSPCYSFNDPQGMCPSCSGLGHVVQFDLNKVLDTSKSLNEGAIRLPGHQVGTYQWQLYANSGFFSPDKPLNQFTEQEWHDLLHGTDRIVPIRNTTGKVWSDYTLTYEGLLDRITRLYLNRGVNTQNKAAQRLIQEFTTSCPCPDCGGKRLNPAALGSRLIGYNIAEMGDLEINDLIPLLNGVTDPIGQETAHRIVQVLRGITDMGLGYLNLNRPSPSLSGGETQRLRMVRYLGSNLTGLTYVFDEPSAGLHPKDVDRLGRLLLRLRDRGNSILVVEHNPAIIRIADEIIDMGPDSGRAGGQVLFQGNFSQLLKQDTRTARSLRSSVRPHRLPRACHQFLTVSHASLHNLKDITIHVPRNALTVVSGMAGAGKSSLICGELPRQYPQAIHIGQAPIGQSSRSTPASYIGIMDEIRRMFARENGVPAALFSYNSKGACPVCGGKGVIKTEMAFMDPVVIPCEACHGTRFSEQALACSLSGKSILDVLAMTACEALSFFPSSKIRAKLQTLCDVGLGYLTLGQPTSTLSGGECQRLKLTAHLRGHSQLYLFDEPTTGLHPSDTAQLLTLFHRLVDQDNTLVAIEHNLQIIAQADWIIDLGPEGGKNGGRLLFEGPVADFLHCQTSETAAYLRQAW
ncbi:excinuclease ABC subunit UvrA [Agathobaculum sp. TL06]